MGIFPIYILKKYGETRKGWDWATTPGSNNTELSLAKTPYSATTYNTPSPPFQKPVKFGTSRWLVHYEMLCSGQTYKPIRTLIRQVTRTPRHALWQKIRHTLWRSSKWAGDFKSLGTSLKRTFVLGPGLPESQTSWSTCNVSGQADRTSR